MSNQCLVVIDMINGFIHEGALSDPRIASIIPLNVKLVESFLADHNPVIAFRDAHKLEDQEFEFYPVHCLEGSHESELIDELKRFQDQMLVIPKNTTNGFFTPAFQNFLEQNKDLKEVTICGCCTDICVLQFAQTLMTYAQTQDRPLILKVVQASVDTYHSDLHDHDTYQRLGLSLMKASGIQIL